MGMAGLIVVIKERAVLVVVGVEIFLRQLLVKLDKVVKDFNFQIDPCFASSGFTNSRISAWGTGVAHGQRLIGTGGQGRKGQKPRCEDCFFSLSYS